MIPASESTSEHELGVAVRRVLWAGPLTIITATAAVWLAQRIAAELLPAPREREWLRHSGEPTLFTAVLVTAADFVFLVIAREAVDPIRSYRRVALMALLLSCIPDIAAGWASLFSWRLALLYIAMHIVAWAVTVNMLTRLTTVRH